MPVECVIDGIAGHSHRSRHEKPGGRSSFPGKRGERQCRQLTSLYSVNNFWRASLGWHLAAAEN